MTFNVSVSYIGCDGKHVESLSLGFDTVVNHNFRLPKIVRIRMMVSEIQRGQPKPADALGTLGRGDADPRPSSIAFSPHTHMIQQSFQVLRKRDES